MGLQRCLQCYLQGNGRFLDDYASEGFLGVCIFLVKVGSLTRTTKMNWVMRKPTMWFSNRSDTN